MLSKNDSLKQNCTGCFACINICPTKTISMYLDKDGFFYPEIEKSKCNNCVLCLKVCPVINKQKNINKINSEAISAKSINKETQISSSSGGIFTELAKVIIKQEGVVFGVTFKDNIAKHISIDNIKDLTKIKGSKYLQSYVNDSFKQVEIFLLDDKKVLFSGTPCQIAGLKSFLNQKKINISNLFLVDVVCHGVPSYRIFYEYLNHLGINLVNAINFRNKRTGWKFFSISIKGNKNYSSISINDCFMNGFMKNYFLRKSCYDCKFSKIPRQGDITLGDFWGVPKNYNDYNGISLVLLNNKKGEHLFDQMKNEVSYKVLNVDIAYKKNNRLIAGNYSNLNERYNFFRDYNSLGFDYVVNKYMSVKFLQKFINYLKAIFKLITDM